MDPKKQAERRKAENKDLLYRAFNRGVITLDKPMVSKPPVIEKDEKAIAKFYGERR